MNFYSGQGSYSHHISLLYAFEELRKDALLHPPIDTHWLIAGRGDVIHQAETVEGTGVAETILFMLPDE